MSRRRALLIVNRKARNGRSDLAAALKGLTAQGISLIDRPTSSPEEACQVIRDCRNEADLIILGGGDGTFNAVAEVLVEAALPVGILPLGTANDLARTLGIPVELQDACEIIANGRQHRIDLGAVNGKLFFNVASMGLSTELSRKLTRDEKRRFGVFGYVIRSWDAWRSARPFRAQITADGDRIDVKSIQISVGNGRFYGGGMAVDEGATIDDQRLDLYSLKPLGMWRLATVLPAFRSGRHKRLEAFHCIQAQHIGIETDVAMEIDTDGELTTRTPAHFHVLPEALSVFVPQGEVPGLEESRHVA